MRLSPRRGWGPVDPLRGPRVAIRRAEYRNILSERWHVHGTAHSRVRSKMECVAHKGGRGTWVKGGWKHGRSTWKIRGCGERGLIWIVWMRGWCPHIEIAPRSCESSEWIWIISSRSSWEWVPPPTRSTAKSAAWLWWSLVPSGLCHLSGILFWGFSVGVFVFLFRFFSSSVRSSFFLVVWVIELMCWRLYVVQPRCVWASYSVISIIFCFKLFIWNPI